MAEVERKWYVMKAVTGTERRIVKCLENEIDIAHLKDLIPNVLVPTEKVYHSVRGKKVVSERPYLPSYIFVEAAMTPEIQGFLLGIPGILGFVGCKHKIDPPVALRPSEVNRLLGDTDSLKEKDAVMLYSFVVGEEIKVTDGPFNTFNGVIEEIDAERNRLKIMVKIFGRKTPLELGFNQVEKI